MSQGLTKVSPHPFIYLHIPTLLLPTEPSVKDMEKYVSGLKEALASSRQSVAKVHDALNTTAGRPSPLQDLKDLLLELQQQPILLRVSEREAKQEPHSLPHSLY